MNIGLSAVHTLDELGSFSNPATIIGRPANGSNWLLPGHIIDEFTSAIMVRKRSEKNYSPKTDFETRRENQDFKQQKFL